MFFAVRGLETGGALVLSLVLIARCVTDSHSPLEHAHDLTFRGRCMLAVQLAGGGVLIIMHGRSRMTEDHRIPTTGTEHVGFSPPRQALLAPSAKRGGGGGGWNLFSKVS